MTHRSCSGPSLALATCCSTLSRVVGVLMCKWPSPSSQPFITALVLRSLGWRPSIDISSTPSSFDSFKKSTTKNQHGRDISRRPPAAGGPHIPPRLSQWPSSDIPTHCLAPWSCPATSEFSTCYDCQFKCRGPRPRNLRRLGSTPSHAGISTPSRSGCAEQHWRTGQPSSPSEHGPRIVVTLLIHPGLLLP